VVADVKQLDPGPEDARLVRELVEHGGADAVYVPGARVRQEITDAKAQLRNLAGGAYPGVLVLYNNTGVGSGHFTAHDVLTALYGQEVLVHAVPNDPRIKSRLLGHQFGGRRGVNRTMNTSLSAIAVLRDICEPLSLDVYHNCYAALPLAPDLLRGETIRHYGIHRGDGRQFQDWHSL
jgi:hypothetical protein